MKHARNLAAASVVLIGTAMLVRAQNSADDPAIGVLLVAGDIAKCGNEPRHLKDEATADILKKEVEAAKTKNIPVRVLALGDLAYDTGTDPEFKCFDASWGPYKDIMLPVPGNHEYEKTNPDGAPYFRYFAKKPSVILGEDEKALVSMNGAMTGYYAVNFPDEKEGPWRLIALNAYVKGKGAPEGQLKWLKADLEQASKPGCVVAFWHPFRFSSGLHGHGDNQERKAPIKLGSSMEPAYRVLYDHGATLILAGHDHSFEQFARQDAAGTKKSDGVRSFVIGTGGGPLYNKITKGKNKKKPLVYDNKAPNSERYAQDSHGVLKIELFKDRYQWSFLPIAGDAAVALPIQKDDCNKRT
jgi:hypothetical protein